jgi:hypothetical protein
MMSELDIITERFNTEETLQDKEYFLSDIRKMLNELEADLEEMKNDGNKIG